MAYSEEQLAAMVRGDSVHRGVYTDPAIFDMEMERIYGRAWIYVGHESQVPRTGDYHTTRLGDQDVLMVRAADGRAHVLYNRCPHKGAKVVADGEGCAGKFFRCPYHAWTFKLDGSHLGVPLKQGLEGTSYDPADPTFSMRRLARVDSYRGFVFASQSAEGPLEDFLGGVRSSIDNLRPLAGGRGGGGRRRVPRDAALELEGVLREPARHHARPRHARVLVRRRARRSQGNRRDAVRAAHHGRQRRALRILGKAGTARLPERPRLYGRHLQPGAAERDPISRAHFETLAAAYGEDKARQVLGMNRHNTVIYGSGSPHTVFQQFRVIRPVAVDRTLIEIQTFRCKGAPDGVFKRAMLYANVINSPSSNVMPDDIELYNRCQEGNATRGGDGSACTATTAPTAATSRAWCRSTAPANCPCATSSAPGATTCRPAP